MGGGVRKGEMAMLGSGEGAAVVAVVVAVAVTVTVVVSVTVMLCCKGTIQRFCDKGDVCKPIDGSTDGTRDGRIDE